MKDAVKIMSKKDGADIYGEVPISLRPLMRIQLNQPLDKETRNLIEIKGAKIIRVDDNNVIWVRI